MLQGASTFAPPATVAAYLESAAGRWRGASTLRKRRCRSHQRAERKDSYETAGGRYSSSPLVHPAPDSPNPCAAGAPVRIKEGNFEGFVSLAALERKAPKRDALLDFIEEHPDAMRWAGLSDLKFGKGFTNKLEGGNLILRVDNFPFRIGGFLKGAARSVSRTRPSRSKRTLTSRSRRSPRPTSRSSGT